MSAVITTFIIGTDGNVRQVFEKVNLEGHGEEVLEWVKANPG